MMRHLLAVAALLSLSAPAFAEVPNNTVKIGVLSDFSGPFADQAGEGSLVAARMAAEDFAKESKGLKADIISADHQNKPDIGASIARRWVDQEQVSAIVDLPNSGVALAVNTVMRDKNRTMLASGSATSDLTGGLRLQQVGAEIGGAERMRHRSQNLAALLLHRLGGVALQCKSKGRYDYYKLVRTIATEDAFRPLNQGGCDLVR